MHKILGLPVVASEHGPQVDNLIIYMHWLMAVLFIGWLSYFFYVLFRFRKSRHPRADYVGARTHASSYIECAIALVEGILLIGFAVPLWAKVVDQMPNEKEATVVRIMAQQFGWNIRYPGPDGSFGRQDVKYASSTNVFAIDPADTHGKDDIQTLNDLHVVVNKPVIVYLSSKDVIHSFKVIALRVTQDAIPGMLIPVWFTPLKEGKYQINCAQLCGTGHSLMASGFLTIEKQEDFDKWIKSKAGGAASFE